MLPVALVSIKRAGSQLTTMMAPAFRTHAAWRSVRPTFATNGTCRTLACRLLRARPRTSKGSSRLPSLGIAGVNNITSWSAGREPSASRLEEEDWMKRTLEDWTWAVVQANVDLVSAIIDVPRSTGRYCQVRDIEGLKKGPRLFEYFEIKFELSRVVLKRAKKQEGAVLPGLISLGSEIVLKLTDYGQVVNKHHDGILDP